MLGLFKKRKQTAEQAEQKTGLLQRFTQGLRRTRTHFSQGMANLILGKKTIDQDLFEELETQLLVADVGVNATQMIMRNLTERVARKQLQDPQALLAALQQYLLEILLPCCKEWHISTAVKPYVILMIGVNGSGKTTTIGKLAKYFQAKDKQVILAAGDTFRAAAVEQLQIWGERNDVPVIAQQTGADSASVIYDACTAAKARQVDFVIADTAGRLHTQSNLMEELKKVKRVCTKLDVTAPHEVMLVIDASVGQNALVQAQQFSEAMNVTGIILTKLDGTAKGGVIFAIAEQLKIPIRFIGMGESLDDLKPFVAQDFVEALFA